MNPLETKIILLKYEWLHMIIEIEYRDKTKALHQEPNQTSWAKVDIVGSG